MKSDRVIFASPETQVFLADKKAKQHKIFSFFPVDHWDCECKTLIEDWKIKLGAMNDEQRRDLITRVDHIECPKDKTGKQKYQVTCTNCKAILAECYASDGTLSDWFDLHYIQETNGKKWTGCLTVNVSPLDGKIGFECCCGQDTRDFRSRRSNLHGKELDEKITETSSGREFGLDKSKFKAVSL